jgi:hypothetical protein
LIARSTPQGKPRGQVGKGLKRATGREECVQHHLGILIFVGLPVWGRASSPVQPRSGGRTLSGQLHQRPPRIHAAALTVRRIAPPIKLAYVDLDPQRPSTLPKTQQRAWDGMTSWQVRLVPQEGIVILSETQDLLSAGAGSKQVLRFAQDDKAIGEAYSRLGAAFE